ncbi:hypothetical protein BLX42_14170 [Pseudomonas sp. SG-MS2]|uniref:CHAT domain-containing protein n=1 Tax=Pseudomonas sp. SG-MS2 TaxID=1914534 RepID=UPI0013794CA4|nr:CHAT domain-containing protein [Pseudomonas sp. SG-MS2]KAF1310443.1 hypothetical protein BLX42_14170 [Pseudomonas sp. SG-MS2]
MSTSAISHLVVVPSNSNERRTTFFQGYSEFWYPDFIKILRCLVFFPHDASDIYLSGENFVKARSIGACLQVDFLRGDLLKKYLDFSYSPLTVLWSTDETVDCVEDALSKLPSKPLHITAANKEGVISISELSEEIVNKLIDGLFLRAASADSDLKKFRSFLESKGIKKRANAGPHLDAKGHNCTEALIEVLVNYGAQIKVTGIKPSGSTTEHISGMLHLMSEIDSLRSDEVVESPFRKNDAIVHCPSVYTYLYRAEGKQWRDLNRHLTNPKRNFLKATLIRGKGYGNSSLAISKEDVFNPYDDKILSPLLRDRQIELAIFTTTISIVASNQFVPALRLPNSVMLHHDKLKQIGQTINSNSRQWHEKLSGKFFEYSELIKTDIGELLLSGIFNNREKILAVCDFPIEWISIDLLPVMFRHELSRIPTTPGNVTSNVLLSVPKRAYGFSALCDILIIRSFDENDKIRDHLSRVVEWGQNEGRLQGLRVQLVDVASKEEIIEVLRSFKGIMVVFDCHGGHGGEKDSAWLHIGDEKVDVWHLYQSTRVPPIVVLAACSTHPVDGSHASVANGFLESGACSVLSTFAPINSDHAATFVIRLLTRIAVYLPIALKSRPYTWREIISGLFKMSYTRDVLTYLRDEKKLLSQNQYAAIHIKTNILVNSLEDRGWFDKFKLLIGEELRIDMQAVNELFLQNFQFVETMLMAQLGRPENIVIIAD